MMEYLGVTALLAGCTLVGTVLLSLLSVTDIAMLFLAGAGAGTGQAALALERARALRVEGAGAR